MKEKMNKLEILPLCKSYTVLENYFPEIQCCINNIAFNYFINCLCN